MSVVLFFTIRYFLEAIAMVKGRYSVDLDLDLTETSLYYKYSNFGSVTVTYNYTSGDLMVEWSDEGDDGWVDDISSMEEFEASFFNMQRNAQILRRRYYTDESNESEAAQYFSEDNTDEEI